MSAQKVKVIYIAGYGRSGSTLLDRLFGQMNGFCPGGEIIQIWNEILSPRRLCGCGRPVGQCEFWNAVLNEAFGKLQSIKVDEFRHLQMSTSRSWHFPLTAWPFLATAAYRQQLTAFASILSQLYKAIQTVSGSTFVVDSSKVASYALILNQAPGIDLYVIHLTRDSRAVAYSRQRVKVRVVSDSMHVSLPRKWPSYTAVAWSLFNCFAEFSRAFIPQHVFVRYEDFVANPIAVLQQVAEAFGIQDLDPSFLANGSLVDLKLSHTVASNTNHFDQGLIEIRPDIEWQAKMRRIDKYLVTALTWPLLLRYGYVGR